MVNRHKQNHGIKSNAQNSSFDFKVIHYKVIAIVARILNT